jgi:hypothetical protein
LGDAQRNLKHEIRVLTYKHWFSEIELRIERSRNVRIAVTQKSGL